MNLDCLGLYFVHLNTGRLALNEGEQDLRLQLLELEQAKHHLHLCAKESRKAKKRAMSHWPACC